MRIPFAATGRCIISQEKDLSDSEKDVIVIGTGIAGLAAAKYAAEKGLSVLALESNVFGGLVLNINELEGELQGSGAELASNMLGELGDLGAENVSETVTGLSRVGDALLVSTDVNEYRGRAVIVASGARLKRLGIPGEAEFEGRGVAQCADCDGPLYQDQEVVVVGGGDSALQEALVLADYAKQVHLIHRSAKFRARPELVEAVAGRGNIAVRWNTVVEAITGSDGVAAVGVRDTAQGKTEDIACSGIFAYVGLAPNSEFVPAEIARDEAGRLLTDASMQTKLPGVFAIGAVRSGYGGMLADAMAEATVAGDAAVKFLAAK
jgi:thioredoxin reductase (NADPH)